VRLTIVFSIIIKKTLVRKLDSMYSLFLSRWLIFDQHSRKLLPVGITFRVEWTHVADLLQVNVGEDEFVITGVDDGRSVRAREHVGCRHRTKHLQNCRLSAENHLLLVTQHAWRATNTRTVFSKFCQSIYQTKKFKSLYLNKTPHRGLPPCRGGGAYAPMTRTII